MVRIIIKGGVWKNTEDEVLKAAIAKYGKNQWARISSLLVRKTPKQCKARWYEWLDPSIKKTEWSKTEDEKLLHLAKLMPTQWRTIAPIVGRTATQCLERYQKLLDEAEAKENEELGLAGPGGEAAPSADDVRRLRPGEIDPDPETKPARPDPIDMDEDEKEMLSEARARLANTQGKKAKRKARERQLEEARRLAVLQKKRELKAAGIIMRHKTKRKGMDYNADIPFEKKAAPGFYDTSEEQARITSAPVGQTLRRLENKRKPEEEEAERKKRQRKNDSGKEGANTSHQTKFVTARDAQIQKLKEAESIGRRRKLMLPTVQVGEVELEEIVKIGLAGENTKALVEGTSDPSERLLSDYESLGNAKMARTPRTAPQQDNVLTEARNLRNMMVAQTPLLGEENTPLHAGPGGGTGFEGATPRHQVAFTPNPLATPLRGPHGDVLATPRSDSMSIIPTTPISTPMRDDLSINPIEGHSLAQGTPRDKQHFRDTLRSSFRSLPRPENNFELLVPEVEAEDIEMTGGSGLAVEDAAERDARLKKLQEETERRNLARRSQAVQLGLPRPAIVEPEGILEALNTHRDDDYDLANARQLLHSELVQLLRHDSVAHPVPGTTHAGRTQSTYVVPDDKDIAIAQDVLNLELAESLGFPRANSEQVREGLAALSKSEGWHRLRVWDTYDRFPTTFDSTSRTWRDTGHVPLAERSNRYSSLLEDARDSMAKQASKSTKAEKKLGISLAGYQARSLASVKRVTEGFRELQNVQVDYSAFSQLRINESAIGPRRVVDLREDVAYLERRERVLQERYAELDHERRESEHRVAAIEDRLMREAEQLNEAALAKAEEDA